MAASRFIARPQLQDLLLMILDSQELSDEHRIQLYPTQLQSWQRVMAGDRLVPVPAKTLDELIIWMIECGELVSERSSAVFSALETQPLGYSTFLRILCIPDEIFPAFYGPRMLASQIRIHKRSEDVRLLFRIFLGLEQISPRSRSYYYPFYTIFLELKDVIGILLPALESGILGSYCGSFADGIAALTDYLGKSEDLAVSDARVWWQDLLTSRKPEFAAKLRNLPDAGKSWVRALEKLLESPQLQDQSRINTSLRSEISAALKAWQAG